MLRHPIKVLFILFFIQTSLNSFSQVSFNQQKGEWTLRSGKNRYVVNNTPQGIEQTYLVDGGATPEASAGTHDYHLLSCTINGKELNAADFTLVNHQTGTESNGVSYLKLTLHGKSLPLQAIVICKGYNNTGVFTRSIQLINTSQQTIRIASIPSLSAMLPSGDFELQYLKTEWGKERRFTTEPLLPDSVQSFVINKGRSGEGYSSWFSLVNKSAAVRYMAQLAYSGNWQMQFLQNKDSSVALQMGMRFDNGGTLALDPEASFQTPEVAFTLGRGDMDEVANQLHRYQGNYVIPAVQTNTPLLVEYNTWFAAPNKVYVKEIKRLVDSAAALGCEAFVLDAGWYNEQEKDWSAELGNWFPTKTSFPNGLEELVNYVHQNKMLFGIWVEIESVGRQSNLVKEHPDWFLQNGGKPVFTSNRYHLNFANDSARNWALATISLLVNRYKLKWIKIDYNNSVGETFDKEHNGIALHNHLQGYFKLLDTVHQLFPSLIVENCASGGLRTDLGTMKHTNTAWLSDITYPHNAPQLVWGATLEFTPDINNYWMTGDTVHQDVWFCKDAPLHPEWWSYMFRVAMTGQFGISSRLERWNGAMMDTARQNIQFYKRIRTVIQDADVYHLTPIPDHDKPLGCMAIQYQNGGKNLLFAYRFENGKDVENHKLRSLDPNRSYVIYIDGKKAGQSTGNELMNTGTNVNLKYDFSAAIIEINEVK